MILHLLLGCIETRGLPDVGPCAEYPDGIYGWGEMGIGKCLAGPLSVEFVGERTVLLTNANPFLDFTGGSVMTLDLSGHPLDGSDVAVTDLPVSTLDLPSFPSYAAVVPNKDWALVPNRLTEDGRTRVGEDDLYVADISDPSALAWADVAEDGGHTITLGSDPALVSVYEKQAFVANLTDHTISVLELGGDTISIVDAVPAGSIDTASFTDLDASGSNVEVASLEVADAAELLDESWTLRYAEGTSRAWVVGDEGLIRWQSQGDSWFQAGESAELDADAADPQPYVAGSLGLRLVWAESDGVHAAVVGEHLGDWSGEEILLEARPGEWDSTIEQPYPLIDSGVHYIFYAAGGSIGLASSEDGSTFTRRAAGAPILEPPEGQTWADPSVLWDPQLGLWRMWFAELENGLWSIRGAWSTDLVGWTVESGSQLNGVSMPTVSWGNAGFEMVAAVPDGSGGWITQEFHSFDGRTWTSAEAGPATTHAEPRGAGVLVDPARTWTLEGDNLGPTGVTFEGGDTLRVDGWGFSVAVSAGWTVGTQAWGDFGANGVRVDDLEPELGLVYVSLTDVDGKHSIGALDADSGLPLGPVLEPGADWDVDGVSQPVVFPLDGGWGMLYAATAGSTTRVGLATSTDGLTWSAEPDPVMDVGEDWDSFTVVPGSVIVEEDGSFSMWYTGSDGSRSRIGLATSADARSWTRVVGPDDDWILGTGSPGDFDDSAVRQPWVVVEDGVTHLWYAGFDGERWSIGYARRNADQDSFSRLQDINGEVRAQLVGAAGSFDGDDAYRPVVTHEEDGSWTMIYTGEDNEIPRSGLARGEAPEIFWREPALPTTGDTVRFSTHTGDGDEDELAIPLARQLDGFTTSGLALSSMWIDEERGFLIAGSKLSSYLYVVDVRDDSNGGYVDGNYLDLEAVLVAESDVGSYNFRGIWSDGHQLWATNTYPESLMLFDLDAVPDDSIAEVHRNAVVGMVPMPRGLEADQGADSQTSIGPAGVLGAGDYLFVANYNDNSVSIVDRRRGALGLEVARVDLVGENPHALGLSEDGKILVVACYVGQVVENGRADSTLALIDADPESPTFGQLLGRVVNQ